VHEPASTTHAWYWQTVTSVRAILNPGTVTECTGVALEKSVEPIWYVPPGIVTQSTGQLTLQAAPVQPLVHVWATLP